MLAGLVKQNLADHPKKERDFERLHLNVGIVAEDAGMALTLEFTGPKLIVHNGLRGMPDVTVRGNTDDITTLSLVELLPHVGLPDPRGENTKKMQAAMKSGSLKMLAPVKHMLATVWLTRVMSVSA